MVDATTPAGATVTYVASASDALDPAPSLTCLPASGATFPIGTTNVTCTAVDRAGNSANRVFHVRVSGAGEQIVALIQKTLAFLDLPSLRAPLTAQLQAVANALVANKKPVACTGLSLYSTAVRAAPANAFTAAEKTELIADATRIRRVIGC